MGADSAPSEDQSTYISGKGKSLSRSKGSAETESGGISQAVSKSSLHASVPSLPKLEPLAGSADIDDEDGVSNAEAVAKFLARADETVADGVDLMSHDGGGKSTSRSTARGGGDTHLNPSYKLDTDSASRRKQERAPSPLSAIIVAKTLDQPPHPLGRTCLLSEEGR